MANKVTFNLEANEAKAVQALLRVVDAQDKGVAGMRRLNREAQKSQTVLQGIGQSVAGWLTAFASIGTVVQGLRAIVSEMKEATALRREMTEVAKTTEELTIKIANLRKDVSAGGIAAVTRDVAAIATQTKIPFDVASRALFYSESAMGAGTPQALAAATTIGQFAAPAGLKPDEVRLIPKLFSITGATDRQKQLQILNQLHAATAGSIAETGEYITPFLSTAVSDIERGFTLSQSLARMTAAIETTGTVSDAATMSGRLADIAAGRNVRALKYLTEQGRTRGVDFTALSDPQRLEFARRLYHEHQAAGTMDELKTKLDVRGFAAMRALFSEVGERKYYSMLPEIEQAAGGTAVQTMAEQFKGTLTAQEAGRETTVQLAQTLLAQERQPDILLTKVSGDILKQVHGRLRGFGEYTTAGLTADAFEQHRIAKMVMQENLALAYEQAGGAERDRIAGLIRETGGTLALSAEPDLVRRAFEATGGFSMVQRAGRLAMPETVSRLSIRRGVPFAPGETYEEPPAGLERMEYYMRGFESYYGLNSDNFRGAVEKLNTAAIKLDNAASKIQQQTDAQKVSPTEALD